MGTMWAKFFNIYRYVTSFCICFHPSIAASTQARLNAKRLNEGAQEVKLGGKPRRSYHTASS